MHKNDTPSFSPWDVPLSLVLLTRLPLPDLPQTVFGRQAHAAWAFPVAGLCVGVLGYVSGWVGMALGLSSVASAVIVVSVLVAITGAMHEDGLADTVDGLWGGYTARRRLEIMKDSHIGSYGVLALLFSQMLRISAVGALLAANAPLGIIAAAVFSRAMMAPLMRVLPNARGTGLSHSVGVPPMLSVSAGIVIAGLLSIVLVGSAAMLAMVCAGLVTIALALTARAKIGGQTGDILGAAQQVSEIVFLLSLAAMI